MTDGSKRAAEGGDRQAGGWGGLGSARARRADCAYRAGPTRLSVDSVVSGFEARHAVPARHDTTDQSCLVVPLLLGLGLGRVVPAHLAIYSCIGSLFFLWNTGTNNPHLN